MGPAGRSLVTEADQPNRRTPPYVRERQNIHDGALWAADIKHGSLQHVRLIWPIRVLPKSERTVSDWAKTSLELIE